MRNEITLFHEFSLTGIGWHALRSLKCHQHWEVWGNTSKGIFLKGHPYGLIFLSNEMFRGPLTINFDPMTRMDFKGIEIGSTAEYRLNVGLVFEQLNLRLIINDQLPWRPGSFILNGGSLGIWKHLDLLGGWLRSATQIGSFAHTCSSVALNKEPGDKASARLFQLVKDLVGAIKETDPQFFQGAARKLIGLGTGLTPSGDDFLSGMALAIARYSPVLPFLSKYSPLFEELIPIIEEKTTLISSELYKIALLGSADERIIGAFDSVIRNNMEKNDVILPISEWGSSSGFDMMSGLYLLMKANQP